MHVSTCTHCWKKHLLSIECNEIKIHADNLSKQSNASQHRYRACRCNNNCTTFTIMQWLLIRQQDDLFQHYRSDRKLEKKQEEKVQSKSTSGNRTRIVRSRDQSHYHCYEDIFFHDYIVTPIIYIRTSQAWTNPLD